MKKKKKKTKQPLNNFDLVFFFKLFLKLYYLAKIALKQKVIISKN